MAAAVLATVLASGCSTSTSSDDAKATSTTEAASTTTSLDVGLNAEVAAWSVCADDPEGVYAEAGTDDPQEAAEYVAEISTDEYRQRSIDGCLAGLRGDPPPAEKCEQQPDFYGCESGDESTTTANDSTSPEVPVPPACQEAVDALDDGAASFDVLHSCTNLTMVAVAAGGDGGPESIRIAAIAVKSICEMTSVGVQGRYKDYNLLCFGAGTTLGE